MIIQIILIIAVIVVVGYGLSRRNTYSGKAWQKIGLILFLIFSILAVIKPNLTNNLAHLVGVGRGADLVLYGLVVAVFFLILNIYLHRQEQRDKDNRLARKIALLEANERYKSKKV